MKKIIVIFCLLVTFSGCGIKENKINLEEIIESKNYVVLDVRTKEEFDTGHVIDAVNIPYDKIDNKINLDKQKTILVYCQSGRRSKIAYENLTNLGYEVFDLGAYSAVTLDKE